ncbi:unnamed protein product [Diamesa hyperborea]
MVNKRLELAPKTDEEFIEIANETVKQAYVLLESSGWKTEKVTPQNDKIQTSMKSEIGKVFRLTAKVEIPAKKLMQDLYYNLEDVPKWNPTLLEAKVLNKVDIHTDVVYSVSAPGGGGFVKSRDFVNVHCWQLLSNGIPVENFDLMGDEELQCENKVYLIVGTSIDYPSCPPKATCIRGQNILSCWAVHVLQDEPESCIFEWLMCMDLKGNLPNFVLNGAYVFLMQEYMTHLRAHIENLKDRERKNHE